MTLIVGEKYELKLDYDTECHGSIIMCKFFDKLEVNKRMKHLPTWKKCLDKQIKAGEKFINYVFVDTDDGEVSHFNVPQWLDEYMLKHELYPDDIMNPIKEFYKKLENGKPLQQAALFKE